ncbi:MAG: DUF3575 domain-containing protein [Flavitalea sp.]
MRYFFLLLSFLLLFLVSTQAQKTVPYPINSFHFLRFNPLGLLDPVEGNLSFGAEYHLQKSWSVAMDASWIFYSRHFSEANASGFMLRPAIRTYRGPRQNRFFELEFQYKQVDHHLHDWIGRDFVNGVPSYEELTSFTYRKQVFGFHFKAGSIFPLTKNKRFWMEAYVGLGARYRHFSTVNQPYNTFSPLSDIFEGDFTLGWTAALPLGMRLMWRLD